MQKWYFLSINTILNGILNGNFKAQLLAQVQICKGC